MLHSRTMDVEPDKLFEQYTVSEVESILQSINNEIERKKVELRTLVGERYRDLIETADTIGEMKSISEQFIKEVQVLNNEMGSLKLKQGPAFKAESAKLKKKSLSYSVRDTIAAQLSILVDLPELIWSAVNSKEYIRASQLYLLGRHIKTGFSVDKDLSAYVYKLPILDLQWNVLSHFPKTILNAAENDLKSLDISSEAACVSLCAMALLDNKELISRFLSLRLDTIGDSLQSNKNVKLRVTDCYNAVLKSLAVLWECFANDTLGKQLFWKMLPKVADRHTRPVIKLLEKSPRIKYLPPIILQFRCSSMYSLELFNAVDLPSKINDWLKSVKTSISKNGKVLLDSVVSLHSLEPLTNIQITNNREWDQLLSLFKIEEKFELWNDVFKPLISSRAKELIEIHCDDGFKDIIQCLENVFNCDDCSKPDNDLRWFVWEESHKDLAIDKITNARGLLLKAKGITPKVVNICQKFENNLLSLHDDLSGLYSSDVTLLSDNNQLKIHQQDIYLKLMLRLKEHICDLTHKDSVTEGQLSVLARFITALPELCPTLQKCLNISADNKSNPWETAKVLFDSVSHYVWSRWEDKAALRLEAVIPLHLKKPASYADLLSTIPQWDVVWIEEGKEDEEKRKSQLRVPSGPSFPLQTVLHNISSELAKAHLPRHVREVVMQKLMPKLITSYDSTSPLCQAESLQNLFDVKYLLVQFIPLTNKDLSALCQEKISQIEKNIDPFDLDVFSPYITANIKSSVYRTQLLFGTYSAMRNDESSINSNFKMPEDPCTLALSKSSAWFPLIPVTNPISKPLHLVKPKTVKSSKQICDQPPNESSKGSSSFLSDWFG